MKYSRNPTRWRFLFFAQGLLRIALLCFSVSGMVLATQMLASTWIAALIPQAVWVVLARAGNISIACGITLLAAGAALTLMPPKAMYISWIVKRTLFDPARGNPLHLEEGQILPAIRCKKKDGKQEQFIVPSQAQHFQQTLTALTHVHVLAAFPSLTVSKGKQQNAFDERL